MKVLLLILNKAQLANPARKDRLNQKASKKIDFKIHKLAPFHQVITVRVSVTNLIN